MRRILRKKQDVTLLIFFWFLTIAWVGLIFWFSSQDAVSSNDVSMKVTEKVVNLVTDYSDYDEASVEAVIKELNRFIREAAHVIMYFIFGLLVATLLNQYVIKYLFVFSFLVCFPIPILDEYNQKFRNAGRVFDTMDLAKDWIGSAIGILLICMFVGFIKQCKEIFGRKGVRICTRCQEEMITNCRFSKFDKGYQIMSASGEILSHEELGQIKMAVCPNCGEVTFYFAAPDKELIEELK